MKSTLTRSDKLTHQFPLMPNKIVVIGAAGMLGHKMFQRLRTAFPGTIATMRECASCPPFDQVELLQGDDVVPGVDVTDFPALEATLAAFRPEYLVNCVGVIKQRVEAMSAVPSITINSLLPHKLAEMAARWGGRVIHFSTDCVFSGKRGGYTEEDPSDAEDLYGKTKFLGEVAAHNALTLRTSIIGRELTEHRSLLDWLLAQNHTAIRGYRRVIYSGVTTNYLAGLVASIIQEHAKLNGLYQVTSEPISKYDLLCLLREAYGLDLRIEPDDLEASDRSMRCDKLRAAIDYHCPPWPALAGQLAEDDTPYKAWLERK
ncbi:MAG: SDR family oxidoreductase [Acidobacteria bacterium]|nr:SDR family oxidoreductase [Acidobacteriota bacterium]